ncbi:MAG: SOS response-associated peptidase [Methylococcales bacterium]
MCGRFHLIATPEQLIENFRLQRLPRYACSYNIPPGQKVLTVVQRADSSYKAAYLHWGLIPHWAKDRKISHQLINARAETLSQKPSFKVAYQQRRCLIPATGFYEWQTTASGKQAYCMHRADLQPFAFAGLWEYWTDASATLYSCTIITTAANSLMRPIHPRMPVIIGKQHYQQWLEKPFSAETRQLLLATDSYQSIQVSPISDWVNNPDHNDTNCLKE